MFIKYIALIFFSILLPKSEIIFSRFNFFIRNQIEFMEEDAKEKKRKEEEKKGVFKNLNKNDL